MKFGNLLVDFLQTAQTGFEPHCKDWKLAPGPFMILIKWQYNEASNRQFSRFFIVLVDTF